MTLADQLHERIAPGPAEARVLVVHDESGLARSLRELVQDEERAAFEKLPHRDDCRSALTSRGLLRLGLSVLSGDHAQELQINRDRLGRPTIGGGVDLNVSRRRGCSAMVLSRGGRCGIDIERIDTGESLNRFLQALAQQGIIESESVDPMDAYEQWCSLEAVLKGDGRGLSEGPRIARPIRGIRSDRSSIWVCGSDSWTLRAIQTPAGFVGMVALSGAIAVCSQLLVDADDRVESMRILCASGIPGQP